MAACTSRAAASILRFRSNCSVMLVAPSVLDDVISVTEAMCPNCRSSGVATDDAMVSGLAPGSDADTEMVGKSTCGSGDTGNSRNATAPASATAAVSSVVAMGRRMNGSEIFMAIVRDLARAWRRRSSAAGAHFAMPAGESDRQTIEEQINHRRGIERQHLAEDQAADDGDAERPPQLRAHAGAERQRNAAQQRRHGGHHDGPEAQQAGLKNGVLRSLAFVALGFQGKIDHHDRVLLDDADEQHDADERDHAEVAARDEQRQQRAHARRRQRGKNRDRMDVAFVQNAQHDVDRHQRGQNQHRLVGQRSLKGFRGSLKRRLNAGRQANFVLGLVHCLHRLSERRVGSEIERKRHHRKLALVADRDGRAASLGGAERRQRNLAAVGKCRGGRNGGRAVGVARSGGIQAVLRRSGGTGGTAAHRRAGASRHHPGAAAGRRTGSDEEPAQIERAYCGSPALLPE